MGSPVRRARSAVALAAAWLVLLAACGGPAADEADPDPADPSPAAGETPGTEVPVAEPDRAVEPPPPFEGAVVAADMLVYSQEQLSEEMLEQIRGLEGVAEVEPMAMAQVSVENRVITVAAVDPATYRRFTPASSAQNEEIWARVAGGELAIPPRLGKRLQDDEAYVGLGNDEDAPRVHIGAYADQALQVDAVVNEKWGEELGMIPGNAVLINTGLTAPQAVRRPVQRIVGDVASIQDLDAVARFGLDPKATLTAFLTGGSVAEAVGSFSYRTLGGGRIAPDPAWVAANIRTEQVPILGAVTCHRVMLPQLRAVLAEVQSRGLAGAINPDEFAGCYYPRFIAGSTKLSLHSFGIAVDLNVPGNLRGTAGEIDREVVAIFKKWGFAWGGDWSYTDPMHFEMNALVEAR
jgi:hypothetical protein